jgi:Uma2 family endonuclease
MRHPDERRMTVEEFWAFEDGTDTRYELDCGVLRAMSPPLGPHRTIVANATGLCLASLRGRPPCRPENEAGIQVSDDTQWQADVAVTCAPPAHRQAVEAPLLIVEVLSPTTRAHDLGRKLPDYQNLAGLSEIWLIDSERRWVQLWRREEPGWRVQDLVGAATFTSEVLEAEVPLDELYRNSGL